MKKKKSQLRRMELVKVSQKKNGHVFSYYIILSFFLLSAMENAIELVGLFLPRSKKPVWAAKAVVKW